MWRHAISRCALQAPVSTSITTRRRDIATKLFAANVEKVQQQLPTAERKNDLILHGRQLFEREILEDVDAAWTPALAASICHAATALRVAPARSQPLAVVVDQSTLPKAVSVMDTASLCRIIHSCLVLRHSMLYEVLFTYIHPIIRNAGTLDAVSCAVLLNAYGRAQVHHGELYSALCERAAAVMRDGITSIAHVANVAHALSRVGVHHAPLFLVLRDKAIQLQNQATPLILVTMLDAFAEVNAVDDELFTIYEGILERRLEELSAPLIASLLSCLVKAKRTSSTLFTTCGSRAVRIAETFDPLSIAKTCDAYFQADQPSEDVFGALAERACRVASDFRSDEIASTLRALSAFDLFDAELFPLLAARLVSLSKQRGYIDAKDAATILASFAAVQERSDELIHVCCALLNANVEALSPEVMTNALYAFAVLNIRNDAQRTLLQRVKENPRALLSDADSAKLKLMPDRLQLVKSTYHV